jgi:hypothetical protein
MKAENSMVNSRFEIFRFESSEKGHQTRRIQNPVRYGQRWAPAL